jgi:hypothetical protein
MRHQIRESGANRQRGKAGLDCVSRSFHHGGVVNRHGLCPPVERQEQEWCPGALSPLQESHAFENSAVRVRGYSAVRVINEAAYRTATEANIVASAVKGARRCPSLVAEGRRRDRRPHHVFSRRTIDGITRHCGPWHSAPRAVVPSRQRMGISAANVVRAGLQ